jgi:hypothetical protein
MSEDREIDLRDPDETPTDRGGLMPPALPILTAPQFAELVQTSVERAQQPLREALETLTDRLLEYEQHQGDLSEAVRKLEVEQRELTSRSREPSAVAWAALVIGLIDAGAIVVLVIVILAMGLR